MGAEKFISAGKDCHRGRVLFVAYPLFPVSPQSAGGAEQVLTTLEQKAGSRGWQTTVAACNGSTASGQTYATVTPVRGTLDSARQLESEHCRRVLQLISVRSAIGVPFDVVHDHSGSFFCHASEVDLPVLATLHLPRSFYPERWFNRLPSNLFFNCVSKSQARTFAHLPNLRGVVENGIPLERFPFKPMKQDYLLWIGRVCEEKGTHTALDVAQRAGIPIVIAGQVYPFAYHQNYFEREIKPRLADLGGQARFVESPSFPEKLALLQNARAVLVTSSAEETSCLVAMEAAACGTPTVALRRGAIPEVVQHGMTGLLVSEDQEMVAAIASVGRIRPRACAEYAQRNFSSERMFADYEGLYNSVRAGHTRVAIQPLAA